MGKKIWRILLSVSALAIAAYGIFFLISYPSMSGNQNFAVKFQSLNPFFVQSHFLGGAFALITACIQLWLKPGSPLHKLNGYAYVVAVCMGAVGGFYLAFYSHLGWSTGVAFLLLDLFWVVCTGCGIYSAIRGYKFYHHRWMLRSLAFTFAAVSLRLQLPLLLLVTDIDTAYLIVAWSSWIINLILIEIYFFMQSRRLSSLATL